MAPLRVIADLLAVLRGVASAGVLPALAVSALLLSGCGGSDSGSVAPDTSTAQSQAASSSPAKSQSSQRDKGANSPQAAETPGESAGHDGKQGPRIAQPQGEREHAASPQERAEATIASMALFSPALHPNPEGVAALPPPYSCDGKNAPPPLRWQGVPSGSAELILFVLNLEPREDALFFDWAVAGLDPSLEELDPTRLPRGAVVGQNSFGRKGYSVCPGKAERVVFALYAVPRALTARPGFDPAALRKSVLEAAGNAGVMIASYVPS